MSSIPRPVIPHERSEWAFVIPHERSEWAFVIPHERSEWAFVIPHERSECRDLARVLRGPGVGAGAE